LNRLDAARLYLSDSTLEINDSVEIGWYVGTEKHDLIADYAKVVNDVVWAGGYSNVVCVGSSAGGFGALALSRRIRNSVAVVFSPQTTIAGYHLRQRKALAAAAFPQHKTFEQVEVEFGNRVNLRKLYHELRSDNFVHFVQNTGDRFHFEAHYVPFALANGVDPEKGAYSKRRRMNFVVEHYETEHAPPSRRNFLEHIQQAHLNFYGQELSLKPLDPAREAELGPR
jgi:pimeloyl-ACP methyl ester carboxylesterase